MRPTATASMNHPIGFRGRYQATTSPATAKDTTTTTVAFPVASGFCRAASDSGINAAASSTTSTARTDADAGDASQEKRPPARADAPSLAVYTPTSATLRSNGARNV